MKLTITIGFFLLLVIFIVLWDRTLIKKTIVIERGLTLKAIAKKLEEEKIIKNRFAFVVLAKIFGQGNKLKAGEYELDNKMGMIEVIKRLSEGRVIVYKTLIPPGYTLNDIANLLEKMYLANKERFLNLCYDPSFIKRVLSINPPSLEGYLFPDTYFLHKGMDEEEIINLMVARFNEVVYKQTNIYGKRLRDVITLASIIEKEAKIKEEYPIISAVFHNRLKNNMPLESCASVLYALKEEKEWLSIEDTKIPSPYNTYLQSGLPPGPICSPSILAIKAALAPSNVDYLYFVSKGDGSHIFSKTSSSHIFSKNLLTEKRRQGYNIRNSLSK